MEDMDFGQASIDEIATTSSDESTEISVNTAHQTSIDDTPPEAGKFSLTNNDNEEVVLGEPKEQRVDFVDNSTLKDRYPIPNPDSFTQNYDATVSSRRGRAKFRLNQAFTGNRKLATDLNGKIDIMYSELMRKFDALSEHIKRLDGQVAENATAIKRVAGRLPGRTDANPKRQVNVVLLRSGKRLIPSAIEINNAEKRAVVEETGENRSRPIILDDSNTESETPREKELPNTEEAAVDLEEEEEELEEDVEIDRQERTNVDRHATTQTKRELDKAICKKAFVKIMLEMPLSDAIKVSPSIKKYVKDMVSNSFPAAERSVMMVSEEKLQDGRHGFRPSIDRRNCNNIERRVDKDIGRHRTSNIDLTNNANEEVVLGEPKATGRSYEMIDVERERRVDSMDESPLVKIKESRDSLHSALKGQNQFGIYQIDDDTLFELEQRVDFVDNSTLKDRDWTVKSRKMKPPSKQRQDVSRGGKRLIPSTIEINNSEKRAVVEETGENRSCPIILDDPNTESETPRKKELPNTKEAAIDLEEEEEELEEDVEIDRQVRTNVDRHATVNIDQQCGHNVDRRSTPAKPAMERV
ncbi:hypothetical protein DY000_02021273 [Brassica cretica]|uniref:Uncharacterized protein n=1 Tax=Brassica cretica TaxID=69181 RepID=A0ABQ7EBL6_BRACR|nr:hypothetical protein DY000_02021273 [Brassica cretica]